MVTFLFTLILINTQADQCTYSNPQYFIVFDGSNVECFDERPIGSYFESTYSFSFYDQQADLYSGQGYCILGKQRTIINNCPSDKCRSCYNGDPSECQMCRGERGTMWPTTIQDIVIKKSRQCECRENYIENEKKNCICPGYEAVKIVRGAYLIYCGFCAINMKTCYQGSNGYAQGRVCGENRILEKNCTCIDGYFENDPIMLDCFPPCKYPCKVCVDGSSVQCTECFDSLMSINLDNFCVCPPKSFLSSDNKTCICKSLVDQQQGCDYTCESCAITNTNCVTCSYLSSRVYSQGSCLCGKYHFAIDGEEVCVPCQFSCESCDTTDGCIDCPQFSNRKVDFLLYNDNYCNCKQGYAEDISTGFCQPCIETCLTCQTTTDTCSSCIVDQYRELINSQCVCIERYYQSSSELICKQCEQNCYRCTGGNHNNCLQCFEQSFRVLNIKQECVCKLGYGYDDESSEQCLKCDDPICLECDHYQTCTQCPAHLSRILGSDNKCICDSGFYEDQTSKTCQPCPPTCLTCLSLDICSSCNNDMGRVLDEVNQKCICFPGYYEFYKQCIACYYTCLTCISQYQDGCTSCPSSRSPFREIQNKTHFQCLCSSISQIDDGKGLECTNCHYSCSTCYGPDINNCLTCKENEDQTKIINRTLKFGLCSCPNKWYDDQINENCLACHDSCETCFDSNQYSCITCSEIDHRIQQSNSCFCQQGYFEDREEVGDEQILVCKKCDYRCASCDKVSSNCLTCMIGSLRIFQQQTNLSQYNTCVCPPTAPNDVEGKQICQTCHFTCKNCSDGGLDNCSVCDDSANRIIQQDNTGSFCQCKLSYYEIQTPECAACSSYCLGCVDTPDNCTSCNAQQHRSLDGNKCKCAVRFGTQNLSYYENMQDPECIACHYSCYKCYGEQYNQCLTCSDLDLRIQSGSSCVCKPQTIDNGQPTCLGCSVQCQTCGGQNSLCTSCPPNSLRTLNAQTQSCDCPEGYFDSGQLLCEQCDQTCETCINRSEVCQSCSQGSNRLLDQFTYLCECIYGYYDAGNGVCLQCHYSCLQCSGPTKNEGISCPDFISTKRSISAQECICPDQYYDDSQNQLCQLCSSTCYTCLVNQNTCTQCRSGQNRILQGQQCICKPSYYESGGPVCSECDNLCQECQNSTTCTKCDSLLIRTLIQGKCECNFGYFDDGSLTCKQCHFSCLTCITMETNCTSCDNQKFRYLNSTSCVCQSGTIDQGVAICFSCDTRCLTCTNIPTECLTCQPTQFRILDDKQCKCQDGYYENNIKQCIVCDLKCVTCMLNSTTCTSCSSIQNRTLVQSQCICKNGYFADSDDICQQCSSKCQTCTLLSTKCTSCQQGRTFSNNQCNCLLRSYEDASNQCQPCDFTCQTCATSSTNCLSCEVNSNRTLKSQKCICDIGFYEAGANSCLQCNTTCLTCSQSNTSCTSCDISKQRVLIGDACECKSGYFSDGNQICQKCEKSCVTCIQSSTKCTSCDISNTFRTDYSINQYKCPCLPGFYDDGSSICKKCSFRCLNCIGGEDNCTFCRANPGFYRDNISPVCGCVDGYYDDGIQIICQKCSPRCQSCLNSADNCIICETAINRLSSPQCDCKQGFYEDKKKQCQICSINCLNCIGTSNNCITCQPDRQGKDCLCQDGFYEANQLLCQQCSYKCSTCLQDPLNCITCAIDRLDPPNCICRDHYFDNQIDPECQQCDQYCGKCDINGCIDCAANRIQYLKTCICPAESVSYSFTPYCSNCDVAVVQGIFSNDLSELIYTFEYDLQFNFPTQVDSQAYCQYVILEQSLKLIGESPQCRIEEKQLIIGLGSGAIVLIGDQIEFNSEILMHTQCSSPLKQVINQQLQPPQQLLKPQITVSYPIVPVSPCQTIEILIQQQYVNGERNLQLQWQSSLQIPAINIANQLQFQTLTIEKGQIPENSNIEISIKYTNFLGQNDETKIQFQTLSSSVPEFKFKTLKNTFLSWAPAKILIWYSNSICNSGQIQILKNPVQIQFQEVVALRNPQQSSAIIFQQQQFNSEESEGLISAIIPARTLTVNTNYTIMSNFIDLTTKQSITAQLNIVVERSPLMIQIVGNSKIQNYLKSFQVQIQSKDPDYQTEWNQDPEIVLSVECIDLQKQNQPCTDQNNKIVHINKTSNTQFIGARLFRPFTVLLFKVNCSKSNLKASTRAAIILLDEDLPTVNISYPQGYNIRDVNINEKLKFQIQIDKNQKLSDIDFRLALIYNYETVFVKNIPNQIVEFSIWEGFNKFKFINQISIRFQAHNINFLMPQTAAVTLQVNMPPVNSIITITPQEGFALSTEYQIRLTNSKDKDSPILYRYAYYESYQLYQQDILSGRQENLIIIQDFTSVQTFKTLFESGNLTIILTVSDSLGSQVNYTQQIKSLPLYEQWQLQNDTGNPVNTTSKCKQMVSDIQILKGNSQLLLITSQELIKLLRNKIQQDCRQVITQKLQKISQLLFDQLLNSANSILKSRISNTLAKIYELNLESARQLTSEQNSLLCYNSFNNQLKVAYLAQINQNYSDSDYIINNISLIKQQIQKVIEDNNNLIQDELITYDIGDDQTARSLQQNVELRMSYIRILGSLFSNVYDQQIVISDILDKLMDSFRMNLLLDNDGLNVSTQGFGLQVSKIGQKRFQSYIINKVVDIEDIDLSNFVINRYIQLVKYKSNKYYYTKTFKDQFKNGSILLERIETNKSVYEKSIIPFMESAMLDPQVYVDNENQPTKVLKVFQGKLAFNMGVQLNTCNNSMEYDSKSQYKLVCSNYIEYQWVHDSCQIQYFSDKNGGIHIQCYCDRLYPISLMIMNISNSTKQQIDSRKTDIMIEEYVNILVTENITIHAIILIFLIQIGVSAYLKFKKRDINLNLVQQRLDSQKQDEPVGLTQQPKMSTQLFKSNIIYLHEVSRLLYVKYIHLSFVARIILTSTNINVLLTLIHVFDVVLKNYFISTTISIFIQLMFQLVVKILEGFFNGPFILKYFGYFFAISINIGIIALNFLLNNTEQDYIREVVQIVIAFLIVYGPVEILIQYQKLKLAFTISEELRLDPFNPIINLIYYFLQDEIVISLVHGARIY